MIDPKSIEIVYDCDDVLWPLVPSFAAKIGVDLRDWTEYFFTDNNFPPDVVARGNEILHSAEMFREMRFYDGVTEVLRPQQELGVRVKINSHCTDAEALTLKEDALYRAIPGLKPENLELAMVAPNVPTPKVLSDKTLIFVDDAPHHILASTAPINIIPEPLWNMSPATKAKLKAKWRLYWLPNLVTINRFVYFRTKHYLREH